MTRPRLIGCMMAALSLAGCAGGGANYGGTYSQIDKEMTQAVQSQAPSQAKTEAVSQALLPPLKMEMPASAGKLLEPRFDLVVSDAPAAQVFMGIVSGTRYSMLLHPDLSGTISVNLKDVTVLEALDAIRSLYGYEYRLDGSRIYMLPLAMQTKVFKVNYLTGQRRGTSTTRVFSGFSSGGGTGTGGTGAAGATGATGASGASGAAGGSTTATTTESSRISTVSNSDFWTELTAALKTIVGTEGGRNVVVSPQSGVIVVRAMPAELRNVAEYLKASQLSVERQVILEAKIIEVRLNDGYQAGINWAAFQSGPNSRIALGQIAPGVTMSPNGTLSGSGSPVAAIPGSAIANTGLQSAINAATPTGTLFGMAFQTGSFAALLSFLETQGTVHVLSSPRIATINNQKAVLKVGSDDFFVTNVSTTTTTGTATTTSPTVTLQPFFSGIVLDVMPQIDENNNVTLHIHPSVSQVTQSTQNIDLGAGGQLSLPLAHSSVSETDSIVRAQDGQIVVLGGLMTQSTSDDNSQVPVLGNIPGIGAAFRQTTRSMQKRELVILLKPSVVQDGNAWAQDILESQQRIQIMKREASAARGQGERP